jgi:hypothetical protein
MLADSKRIPSHVYVAVSVLFLLLSCAALGSPIRLEDIKARLDCVGDAKTLPWEQVARRFGTPDETPIPAPGSLTRNTRIYKNTVVIFHVETQETTEAGRPKFFEVVKQVEVCKER